MMDRVETNFKVCKLLKDLGDSPAKISKKLRRSGVRGRPRNPKGCPVAQYLMQNAPPGVKATSVRGRDVRLIFGKYVKDSFIPLPPAVVEFVDKFDNGKIAKDLVA